VADLATLRKTSLARPASLLAALSQVAQRPVKAQGCRRKAPQPWHDVFDKVLEPGYLILGRPVEDELREAHRMEALDEPLGRCGVGPRIDETRVHEE